MKLLIVAMVLLVANPVSAHTPAETPCEKAVREYMAATCAIAKAACFPKAGVQPDCGQIFGMDVQRCIRTHEGLCAPEGALRKELAKCTDDFRYEERRTAAVMRCLMGAPLKTTEEQHGRRNTGPKYPS